MAQYRYHVFVCSFGKTCEQAGGIEVFSTMKKAVRAAGLTGTVRVNKAGCMNQCGHGPMVVVYPEDTWYCAVDPDGGRQIVEEHLVEGRPVESLLYIAPPGDNKLVDED